MTQKAAHILHETKCMKFPSNEEIWTKTRQGILKLKKGYKKTVISQKMTF